MHFFFWRDTSDNYGLLTALGQIRHDQRNNLPVVVGLKKKKKKKGKTVYNLK